VLGFRPELALRRVCFLNEQIEVLLDVVRILNSHGIAYMVSGSTAMNFYARPRMTRDVDLVVKLDQADVQAFVAGLSDSYYIDEEIVSTAVRRQSMFNAIHNDLLVKIDFIVRKDEPYRIIEFERRRSMNLGTANITAVAPEDLILSKLLWSEQSHSDQQENDVRNLLESTELDLEYLNLWASRLDVADRLSTIRQP